MAKKSYKITATRMDDNGRRISSNNPETLGDAAHETYATRREAAEECRRLTASRSDYGMADAEYTVERA